MTKQEFIQEAVLRLLSLEVKPIEEVGDYVNYATRLADAVFQEEAIVKEEVMLQFSDPIQKLLDEIDRIDLEEAKKKEEEYREIGWVMKVKKGGYSARLSNIFNEHNIKTIGDLLNMGRVELSRTRNIGSICVFRVCDALRNLYGINF